MSIIRKVTKLFYTKTHEWIERKDSDHVICGITDFSQDEKGKLVFIDLPKLHQRLLIGDPMGVVESVKSASDIFSPLSGIVTRVNDKLIENPHIINESCYDYGWIIELKFLENKELDSLLNYEEYFSLIDN